MATIYKEGQNSGENCKEDTFVEFTDNGELKKKTFLRKDWGEMMYIPTHQQETTEWVESSDSFQVDYGESELEEDDERGYIGEPIAILEEKVSVESKISTFH